MAVGFTREIPVTSDQHRNIIKEVRQRVKMSERELADQRDRWSLCEDKALAFMPEREADVARRNKRDSQGLPQYTTIVIPYTYAVMMAAHTYWSNVFLSRSPVFQYNGLHGETQQQEMAVEALLEYQRNAGGLTVPLYSWLYDVGRYGEGIIGNYWENRVNHVTQLYMEPELDLDGVPTGAETKTEETMAVPAYGGNRLYNVRPHDFLTDPRVTRADFQNGEFCGVRRRLSWGDIKRREKAGFYMNVDKIDVNIRDFPSGTNAESASTLVTPTTDSSSSSREFLSRDKDKKHPDVVPIYEVYIELIPEDWKLASRDYPEKWVITITGDFKTVIGASPLGALHNTYPFRVIILEPDAYALASRAISDILGSIENTINWLVNTHFYNVRASLNNQFVFDPSRFMVKDLQDGLPGKLIRARPTAYGTDLRTGIFQLPVNDVTREHMNDVPAMLGIGERIMGVNDQMMGMLASGGRKTATEVRTSSTFGVNRLKIIAEYMSAMGWEPLGNMLLQNSQQYYDGTKKMRIVGNLAQLAGDPFVQVTPETIAGSYGFVPVDGTMPIDRIAQATLLKDLLGNASRVPQLQASLDWMKFFTWIAQLSGLRNTDQFQLQVRPDQQIAQAAQAGNLVPGPTTGGGNGQQQPNAA